MNSPEFPKEEPITIRGHEFTVFQKGVILAKQIDEESGLLEKSMESLKPGSQTRRDAITINGLLDYAAGQEGQMSSVNIFYLAKEELVFIKAPVMIQDKQYPAVAAIKMSAKDREEFIGTLQDPSINSIEMAEILGNIFKIGKSQEIKISRIAAVNLVVYKESADKIAETLRSGISPKVYEDNKKNIVVQKIPWMFRPKNKMKTDGDINKQLTPKPKIDSSKPIEQPIHSNDKSEQTTSMSEDEVRQALEEASVVFGADILGFGVYTDSPDLYQARSFGMNNLDVDLEDFEGISTIYSMLDIAGQTNSVKHPVCAFRLESEDKDLVFLKSQIKGDPLDYYLVLETRLGSGKQVISFLRNSEPESQHDNTTVDSLIILEGSASEIAKNAFTNKTDAKTLYKENKNRIFVKTITQI